MCKVFIVKPYEPVAVYDPADLEAKVRLSWFVERMKRMFDGNKPVAKKQPKPAIVQKPKCQPAPLQCGGELVKRLEPYWGNEDSLGHYRQRCGEHNHREQACRKTARRRQVVRYWAAEVRPANPDKIARRARKAANRRKA